LKLSAKFPLDDIVVFYAKIVCISMKAYVMMTCSMSSSFLHPVFLLQ
jgi:hypothetical protein